MTFLKTRKLFKTALCIQTMVVVFGIHSNGQIYSSHTPNTTLGQTFPSIGIGTFLTSKKPETALHIKGDNYANSTITIDRKTTTSSSWGGCIGLKNSTTATSIDANKLIGGMYFISKTNSEGSTPIESIVASIRCISAGDHTATSRATNLEFYTTKSGNSTMGNPNLVIKSDGSISIPGVFNEKINAQNSGFIGLLDYYTNRSFYGRGYLGLGGYYDKSNSMFYTKSDGANSGGAFIMNDIFGNMYFSNITKQTSSYSDQGFTYDEILDRTMLKLSNDGTLYAKSIEITLLNQWPDYVFSEDYNLKPLEEVEKHIDEFHHLPGIPSEKEVKDKGINLGDINALMLEKIEELTLYMIDLKKENQLLKTQIESLSKK